MHDKQIIILCLEVIKKSIEARTLALNGVSMQDLERIIKEIEQGVKK